METKSLGEIVLFSDALFYAIFLAVHVGVVWGFRNFLKATGHWNRKFAGYALVLYALSLVVLSYGIERRSLWEDEDQQANTIHACSQRVVKSYTCLVDAAADAQHPPGAYVYEQISLKLFGMRPLAARLPSAKAGALAVFFLFTIFVAATGNYPWSFAGALPLVLHPYVYFYSREGRPHIYALSFGVLALLACYHYFRAGMKRRTWLWLTSCILLLLLSCGLQPPLYLVTLGLVLLLFRPGSREGKFWKFFAGILAAGAVGFTALAPYLWYGMATARKYGWTKPTVQVSLLGPWRDNSDPLLVVERFLGSYGWIYLLVVALGLAFCRKARGEPKRLFFCSLVFGVIFYLLERIVFSGVLEHAFFPRYAIAVLPVCFVTIGCAVFMAGQWAEARFGKLAGWGTLLFLCALVAASSLASPRDQAHLDDVKIDWKEMLNEVAANSRPGDRAVFLYLDVYHIEHSAFFGVKFYYQQPGAQLYHFWEWHPTLEKQLEEANHNGDSLLLAFDLTGRNQARAFFESHRKDWDWSVVKPTYALVKFHRDRAKSASLFNGLADVFGDDPMAAQLRALAKLP